MQTITCVGIASAEAFGTARTRLQVDLNSSGSHSFSDLFNRDPNTSLTNPWIEDEDLAQTLRTDLQGPEGVLILEQWRGGSGTKGFATYGSTLLTNSFVQMKDVAHSGTATVRGTGVALRIAAGSTRTNFTGYVLTIVQSPALKLLLLKFVGESLSAGTVLTEIPFASWTSQMQSDFVFRLEAQGTTLYVKDSAGTIVTQATDSSIAVGMVGVVATPGTQDAYTVWDNWSAEGIGPAAGIPSGEVFGAAKISPITVTVQGIPGAEVLGTPSVHRVLGASSIGSAEAFGLGNLNLAALISGIQSAEEFGTGQPGFGITSLELFGSVQVIVVGGGDTPNLWAINLTREEFYALLEGIGAGSG